MCRGLLLNVALQFGYVGRHNMQTQRQFLNRFVGILWRFAPKGALYHIYICVYLFVCFTFEASRTFVCFTFAGWSDPDRGIIPPRSQPPIPSLRRL